MKLSLYVGETRDLERSLEAIVDAERRGLHAVWLPGGLALDSLTVLALAVSRTKRIRLGAGIAYAWPRHPLVLAQQALTLAAASEGRFEIGIGTGHRRMMEEAFGLRWEQPVTRMLEYGEVLRALLEEGRASYAGRYYRVEAALWLAEREPVPIVLGTLGEEMCRAAGRFADAIMTWLAPASYLAAVVRPAARQGAEPAGRHVPRIVAAVPAALASERRAVLEGLNAAFGGMARAPSYLGMLERAGLAWPADDGGWTEEMLDAVVAWGDERDLGARVQEFADAGVDEVVLWPFPVGGDRAASLDATLDAMQELATR
jgi:F420-dependent oxidoreductase-like protein